MNAPRPTKRNRTPRIQYEVFFAGESQGICSTPRNALLLAGTCNPAFGKVEIRDVPGGNVRYSYGPTGGVL